MITSCFQWVIFFSTHDFNVISGRGASYGLWWHGVSRFISMSWRCFLKSQLISIREGRMRAWEYLTDLLLKWKYYCQSCIPWSGIRRFWLRIIIFCKTCYCHLLHALDLNCHNYLIKIILAVNYQTSVYYWELWSKHRRAHEVF